MATAAHFYAYRIDLKIIKSFKSGGIEQSVHDVLSTLFFIHESTHTYIEQQPDTGHHGEDR